MGAEITDPLKACCCATPLKPELGTSSGTTPSYGFDDYLTSNMDWIIKIQANWRGKVQRMRYYKKREQAR